MAFLISIAREMASFYNEIAIYLLFGLAVAGFLYVVFPESLIRRHLGRGTLGSVFKATFIGVPLPLCSCGVIPVAASLRKSGASKGATIAFLISTPQIGADSFLITYSLLGWVFALFRIAAAFITSLVVGLFVNVLDKEDASVPAHAAASNDPETLRMRLRNLPAQVAFNILGPIANSLVVGILVAGLIAVLVPPWIFERYLDSPFLSMLVMMAIGIPMYVCASASTPIAASLIMKGMSPGAGLVFLLTGPATNAVTIATVARTLGKKTAGLYLAGIALVSLLLGFLLDRTVAHWGLQEMLHRHHGEMLPAWLRAAGSVTLTLLLFIYYFKAKVLDRFRKKEDVVGKTVLNVEGMTCAHCSANVKKAVASVPGTRDIIVDLNGKKIEFNIDAPADVEKVKAAITEAGYEWK
ncbi:MAG: permease [Fibrobacterota bacterium]